MKSHLKLIDRQSRTAKDPTPALTAENIRMIFPMGSTHAEVLDKISFQVETGELICVLGPSGCGKTTLLKIIAGFLMPTGGRIQVFGRPISGPGPDRCVVFQEDALFPWLTVSENIAFGLKGRGSRQHIRGTIDRYVEMVGLSGFKDYLPREISGGMKQRVALARVLVLKPQVLLMDEPFGALDAQSREEMQDLVLDIRKELSHTIVFVTHDINEAAVLADRILLMAQTPGRIAAQIDVPLSRPRKKESDAFHRFHIKLRAMLGGEIP